MKFDDTKEVKVILENMHDFIMSVEIEKKKLNKELEVQEKITIDLLHEIEITDLNAIERAKMYNKLRENRKERRRIKDTLKYIELFDSYNKKFIEKGLLSDTDFVIKQIDRYVQEIRTRYYKPLVLNDLKCSKKESE